MNQTQINRSIRRSFRKRLLPLVERCLIGAVRPASLHHSRQQLDRQTAAEILACFEGDTWLNGSELSGIFLHWDQFIAETAADKVSIGNFCQYLYDIQVELDEDRIKMQQTSGEPTAGINRLDQQEKRLSLLATLYVAGYLPEFKPEGLITLT